MKPLVKLKLLVALVLINPSLFANILNTPIAVPDKTSNLRPDYKWATSSYVGYAWSSNTNLRASAPTKFNQPVIGDTNNSNLGNVPFAGFSLSRRFRKIYKIGFSYDVYGAWAYRKYHAQGIAPTPGAGVEVLGVPYSRSFALDHQGALFNVGLKLPDKWSVVIKQMYIKPEISGGVGVGISKVKAFQALGYFNTAPYSQITTLGATNTTKKLAWQFTVGLALYPKNSAVSFGLAYRYYDGGKFFSSDLYVLNDGYNNGLPANLGAWTGVLKTQQLKMYINAEF
jgi:hypothetical protein